MAPTQNIRNGRTGVKARSKPVVVERRTLPRTKQVPEPKEFIKRLEMKSHRVDGSNNHILVVRLSRNTTSDEREKIETSMKDKCSDLFFNISWRANGNLKVTMKTRTNDCCCSDVLTCVKEVLAAL